MGEHWKKLDAFARQSITVCDCLFVLFHPQYNQEIHYVEPCLNGTLVRADTTNKDVSS